MAEDGAVMEVDLGSGAESGGEVVEQQETQQSDGAQETESPFSPKTSREFSQWLKGLRETSPETAKFVRMAKDAYSRQYALSQIDPKGIDGVRERYSVLDSVIHTDPERGELKGADAIAALQDTAREVAQFDEMLASGDPKALEAFGEDFNEGLAKLAPTILDRVKASNPEAYADAVLPHFVEALASSSLVQNYNAMVDVLNEQMPAWLPDDKKQAWADDRLKRITAMAGGMGSWLNTQADKAGKLAQGVKAGQAGGKGVDKQAQREQEFNKREQEQHWNTNITPQVDRHAGVKFQELFRPFDKRLHLDGATTTALRMEFSKRVAAEAAKDKNYSAQIGRYRGQRNPDPATIVNYAKVQFDKHAKTVMDTLINERYKPFLSGKSQQQTQTTATQQRQAPVTPGVTLVSVKPAMNDIDHKNTPVDWIHQRKYRLTNGKVVQVRQ
jgi:hypothetical protein